MLPDVPSIVESGWPDYELTAWYGFVVPKGTPPAVIETLRQTTVEAINTPVVKSRLEAEGANPIGNTPEEFAAFMRKDLARWAELVKSGAISIN